MEKKYISENRYKKSTAKKRRDISAIRKGNPPSNKVKATITKKAKKPRLKPSIRKERRITRRNIFSCILLLIIIAIILRALLKEEGEPFIPIFFGGEANDQVITIGVITEEDLLDSNINNVVLKELGFYSTHMLLWVNKDYSLNYDAIKSIERTSELEYIITINESSEYNASNIKQALERYRANKESIYYLQLKDINYISVINSTTLKIILNSANPYFIYNLDLPITITDEKLYERTSNSTSSYVEFERTQYASKQAPLRIIVKRYKDMYEGVEAYKKSNINMLVTNQKNVQNILGKYEYNLQKYRNGETIFLFLNQKSEWLKNEEIRRVIAYGVDRDSIINEVMQTAANVIDLPYIYDNVKYKYDIYASENLLLSNGYKKQNKLYTKNGKQIELTLLVNKADEEKIDIATMIKNNLSSIGIKINIEKLSLTDIEKRVKKGTYDLVLSTVTLNNKPDTTFLKEQLYLTDEVVNTINNINNSNLTNIEMAIKDVSNAMSNNISCIGILAKTNYVIYSKDIAGIKDISYLNVFSSLILK